MSVWTVFGTLTLATVLPPAYTLATPPDRFGVEDKTGFDEPEARILAAHNRERAAAKLGTLALDPKLTAAARVHAEDMAARGKMTHDGSDGSSPSDRVKRQEYLFRNVGENVAVGFRNVEGLMRGWMESPHHRENILGKYTQVGIAAARDRSGTPYWCVDFGTPWEKLDPARAGEDLITALNKERSSADLRPLVAHAKLTAAATRIAGVFAGVDSLEKKEPGQDLVTILRRLGYRYRKVAESAASGQPGVPEVVKTWMDKPNLREHVLGDFTEVGVGYANSRTGKPYWCLILARP